MVRVKKSTVRSDTSEKATLKKNRVSAYTKYIRSKQFNEVKDIVYKRQGGICPICGDMIDSEHPGSCHHRSYRYAGMGGEIEAQDCIYIHRDEHREIHRSKLSFQKYSVLNDRNEPVPENHSDLANAIRKERAAHKKKNDL
jgi:hypothetical protein